MKYMGSKSRITKYILPPIIIKNRVSGQYIVDLFCGGCNFIDKINSNRIANDINPYLIACAEALSKGWLPPKDITEEIYNDIKNNIDKYDKKLVGYVGFQLSYGAMWFSTYRRDNIGKRNYSREAFRHVKKQAEKLKGIKFYNLDYYNDPVPPKSIIYCDPPYQNTASYKANDQEFDHNRFWEYCRAKSKEGHWVYISEYAAPEDFKCIWQKKVCVNLLQDKKKVAVEKLFRHECYKNIGYDWPTEFFS